MDIIHDVESFLCDVFPGILLEQFAKDRLHQWPKYRQHYLIDVSLHCQTINNVQKDFPLSEQDVSLNHHMHGIGQYDT